MPALTVVASARVSKTDSDVNGLHMTHAAPLPAHRALNEWRHNLVRAKTHFMII